ncbi:hypothetical protein BDW62DRAFT_218256 [Aspergillus aurantiobrunneus]
MPAKRKRPSIPLTPTLASTRSRRHPSQLEPEHSTQEQNGSIAGLGQSLNEVQIQSNLPETEKDAGDADDLPSISKSPRRTQIQNTPAPIKTDSSSSNEIPTSKPQTLDPSIDPNTPELVRSRPYSGPMRPRTQLAMHLPPLYKLDDIFNSLTNRAIELNLDNVLDHLGDRQLRVATVCSGTESPLLALEMVKNNLNKHFNRELNFRHLFSAEIVPFKQAYIERNFHPRLIFRDVAELKDRVAQTAYGSLEKIPKNADILIAGFSCVDFSGLNNHRKTLDEGGESGGTFWGIVRYAMTYRPRLVILENVKTAPWEKIGQVWKGIDYFAVHADVDTKAYYLPQTRERGYMFCVDKRAILENGLNEEDMREWADVLKKFQRPASSPGGMFLMDADDRRLEQIEKDMAGKIASSVPRATVNWDRYQVRHQGYRLNQGLGYRRPISKSQDDGTCQMPDFAWQTWVSSLPERVWDTIDVNFLRKLADGYDMNYKERCLELSQGLDREMDSRAFGIIGCITPCGIPYMTTRGGPICGLESLALQGLPLNRLSLTQESQRELQDLAGNAMSSTVVGAAIFSALIVGHRALKKGNSSQAATPQEPSYKKLALQGKDKLVERNMHLDGAALVDIPKLQEQATSSARYCVCEGQTSTRTIILKCTLCSHTACSECSGNPHHAYERWTELVRTSPLDFASMFRDILPAKLVVGGINRDHYREMQGSLASDIWSEFLDAVFRAVGDELRFQVVKRSESWTVLYEGKYSVLKLVIDSESITWLLFANPRKTDPTLCLIREVLSKPIARMVVSQSGSILEGDWEICGPLSSSCSLEFFGYGSRIQSYEAKCGLEKETFRDSLVWTHIAVQGTDDEVKCLEIDVRGTYELLQDCGTANACLHRRPAADGNPAVYLYLDPTKLGEPSNDSFVFALEHRRNPGYTPRLSIAEVSHQWSSLKVTEKAEPTTVYHRKWFPSPTTSLRPYDGDDRIRCYNLDPRVSTSITNDGCHDANTIILAFTMPSVSSRSITDEWEVTDPIESQPLKDDTWLLLKAAGYPNFREWNEVTATGIHSPCTVCVPAKPGIRWGRDARGRIKPYEDPYSAARYEREIKSRPLPFLLSRKNSTKGSAKLRLALNIQTLLHKAYGRLVNPDTASFYWRLITDTCDVKELSFPKFNLKSNRNDHQSMQPPNFQVGLRPEQLRSLSWMIGQEGDNIEPFIEEETEEAFLPLLMWRAEGKVTTSKTVRGGILADDVGYGKTAIVLGLMDTLSANLGTGLPLSLNDDGFIPSRATLIVIPNIMFLEDEYNITIQEIRNCDIILVSWSVFNASSYYQRLQRFTGRSFDDWFSHAHGLMKQHLQALTENGPPAFLETLWGRRGQTKNAQEEHRYVPSKRLRGKKYTLASRDKDREAKSGVSYADISSAEEDSDTADEVNPNVLEAKVDSLLQRVPPKTFGVETEELDEDRDTEGEDSHTRSRNTWDDWKEFSIRPTGTSQHWKTVTGVPLHAFAFNRLVIDEFTYANTDRLNQLLALQARSKWVLSGTPPLNDFADVNTIAPFLGVHLGIDDDDASPQNRRLKDIRKQRSDAETFQSFRAPRSEAWHRRRHEIAQTFLDRFARRNVAEIDEIPSTEHIVLVRQSPAEKAIYLELYKQLMTYNRQLRRSNNRGGFGSDQAERLDEIIASSSTIEEALLKRCTSLALQGRWGEDGTPEAATCVSLIKTREEQLGKLKDELKFKLKLAAWVYCACDKNHEKWSKFVQSVVRHDFGDMSVTGEVYPLLNTAIKTSKEEDWKLFFASPSSKDHDDDEKDTKDAETGGPKPTLLPTKPTQEREYEPILREVTTTIRNLVVEWVLRNRALRFLKAIRQAQTNPQDIPSCARCQNQPGLLAKTSILGSCGHALCSNCTQQTFEKEECAVDGCRGSGKRFNLINAMTLGCDTFASSPNDTQEAPTDIDQSSRFGGTKLDALIDIISNQIPYNERALLFIQFPDLMDIASRALTTAGIKHTVITSSDRSSSKKIDRFQTDAFGDNKVLLLNLGSEMAAGLNLQCANHIIFLSPLFAQTQYDYDSSMIQAIGRCRRYGQTKHVHVYHLLAKMTIDVNIFQERRGKVLVERDRKAVLVDAEEALESEAITCQGPEMVIDNAF